MSTTTADLVRDHVIGALKWAENEIVDDIMEMIKRRDERITALEKEVAILQQSLARATAGDVVA